MGQSGSIEHTPYGVLVENELPDELPDELIDFPNLADALANDEPEIMNDDVSISKLNPSEVTPVITTECTPEGTSVIASEDMPVIASEDTPVIATEDMPATATEDTPVITTEDTPVITTEDTPVIAAEGTTVITSNTLSLTAMKSNIAHLFASGTLTNKYLSDCLRQYPDNRDELLDARFPSHVDPERARDDEIVNQGGEVGELITFEVKSEAKCGKSRLDIIDASWDAIDVNLANDSANESTNESADTITNDPVTNDPVTTDPATTDAITTDAITTDAITTDTITTTPHDFVDRFANAGPALMLDNYAMCPGGLPGCLNGPHVCATDGITINDDGTIASISQLATCGGSGDLWFHTNHLYAPFCRVPKCKRGPIVLAFFKKTPTRKKPPPTHTLCIYHAASELSKSN